jgi:hypothetical protein
MPSLSYYALSNEIRDASFFKASPVFGKIESLLLHHGGMRELIRQLRDEDGKRSIAFDDIIDTIIQATLRWNKPYEYLRVQDFADGRPTSGGADCSEITIRRGLQYLVQKGVLCRFTINSGRTVFYALNVREIMCRLRGFLDGLSWNAATVQTARRLYQDITESQDFQALAEFIIRLRDAVICGLDDVRSMIASYAWEITEAVREVEDKLVESVGRCGESMIQVTQESANIIVKAGETVVAGAIEIIRNAKQASRERGIRKEASKAGRAIIKDTGFLDAEAALALWHKEVRDCGQFFGYQAVSTRKVHGQMKNWLKELVDNGLSEKEIRQDIRTYIRAWKLTWRREQIVAVSKEGRPYKANLSSTPEFGFFYAMREALIPLLVRYDGADTPYAGHADKEPPKGDDIDDDIDYAALGLAPGPARTEKQGGVV